MYSYRYNCYTLECRTHSLQVNPRRVAQFVADYYSHWLMLRFDKRKVKHTGISKAPPQSRETVPLYFVLRFIYFTCVDTAIAKADSLLGTGSAHRAAAASALLIPTTWLNSTSCFPTVQVYRKCAYLIERKKNYKIFARCLNEDCLYLRN